VDAPRWGDGSGGRPLPRRASGRRSSLRCSGCSWAVAASWARRWHARQVSASAAARGGTRLRAERHVEARGYACQQQESEQVQSDR